jgi:predicted metal-dependent phosphoesterase TrpH
VRIDLHIHSKYSSDGVLGVRKIIETALKRGLDGVAICDHNVFKAYEEARSLAPPGFVVIPGVEYGTDMGHVLALFVTGLYDLKKDARGLRRLAELREAATEDGALLVAAHPYRKRESVPDGFFEYMDGIETRNSRDMARAPGNEGKARSAAGERGAFMTGGSDAHIAREIGACRTVVPDGTERTAEGVRAALEARLSAADGEGGKLRYQALGKMRRTRPKTFLKDAARLIDFTAEDLIKKWR